jgi:hypothetical protein
MYDVDSQTDDSLSNVLHRARWFWLNAIQSEPRHPHLDIAVSALSW